MKKSAACLVSLALLVSCADPKERDSDGFTSPNAAVDAFIEALRSRDRDRLAVLLGPEAGALLRPGDEVAANQERLRFLQLYATRNGLVERAPDEYVLEVGPDRWPFPIPLVNHDGAWEFDSTAGALELLLRRIGRNELAAIEVCLGYYAAQMEYAAAFGSYAPKLRSDPGQRNGLFWEVRAGEPPSPAGPLLAQAEAEGYDSTAVEPRPYHGYLYRSLPSRSKSAKAAGSFALVAYPYEYGSSGLMTFVITERGDVFQRDLGADTDALVRAMREFDTGTAWLRIDP